MGRILQIVCHVPVSWKSDYRDRSPLTALLAALYGHVILKRLQAPSGAQGKWGLSGSSMINAQEIVQAACVDRWKVHRAACEQPTPLFG